MDLIYKIDTKKELTSANILKFKKLAISYINYTLNSKSLKVKPTAQRLNLLYTYIISKYNINKNINNIKYIIIYIIKYLNINNKGLIYINNNKNIGEATCDTLYRLIEFGNLELKGCAIFNEAFNYANKMLFIM